MKMKLEDITRKKGTAMLTHESDENELIKAKKENPQEFGVRGWICPVCGAGNSPFNQTCPCKNPPSRLYPGITSPSVVPSVVPSNWPITYPYVWCTTKGGSTNE